MEMTWLARMEVIDAVPKIQPREFHLRVISLRSHYDTSMSTDVPSSIESNDLSKPSASCYARPMIYTGRRGNGRRHLSNTGRNHKVAACDSDELVDDASRAAVV